MTTRHNKSWEPAERYDDPKEEVVLKEMVGDLFSAPRPHSLAHCISWDCRLGKGIAKIFRDRFGRVEEIRKQEVGVGGVAVLKEGNRFIYNLVTKKRYYDKPRLADLRHSLK